MKMAGRQPFAPGLNQIRLCSYKAEQKESEFIGKINYWYAEYKLKPACHTIYLRGELYCDGRIDHEPK